LAPQINKVAIITKIKNELARDAARFIANFLEKKEIKIFSVESLDIENVQCVDPTQLVNTDLDLVFAIGGDGTTLRAFRMIKQNTPVFSLNIGGTRGRPINRINMTIFIRVDMNATDKNAFKSCSKLSNLLIGTSDKKYRYCHKNQK